MKYSVFDERMKSKWPALMKLFKYNNDFLRLKLCARGKRAFFLPFFVYMERMCAIPAVVEHMASSYLFP